MATTERWPKLRHAAKLRLAGFVLVVLYATPWLLYGVVATQRGHQEDNGLWLIGFSAALVAIALLGFRRPVLAGSILILPSVVIGLSVFAYDAGVWASTVLICGTPFVAGLLFLVDGLRDRRARRRMRPSGPMTN